MNQLKNSQILVAITAGIIIIGFLWLSQNKSNLIIPSFCFLVGSLLLHAGMSFRNSSLKIKNFGYKAQAKIIDYKARMSGGENIGRSYHPIIEFVTKDLEIVTHQLKLSEIPNKLNSIISIYYLEENQEYQVIKDSKWWITFWPLVYATMGTVLLVTGVIYSMNLS